MAYTARDRQYTTSQKEDRERTKLPANERELAVSLRDRGQHAANRRVLVVQKERERCRALSGFDLRATINKNELQRPSVHEIYKQGCYPPSNIGFAKLHLSYYQDQNI